MQFILQASSLVHTQRAARSTNFHHNDDWLNYYCVARRDQYPFVDE